MLELLKLKIQVNNREFDEIYPPHIRVLSERHFTSFKVAGKVAEWLNEYKEQLNIIDLGCGVGKFCFIMSTLTKHRVTGVDFRKNYIQLCEKISLKFGLTDLKFIHQNITELDFKEYNVFYFFNSFLEQIDETAKIDESKETSQDLYALYESKLKDQLFLMPSGTLLITYYATERQIPADYTVVKTDFECALKMWVRD